MNNLPVLRIIMATTLSVSPSHQAGAYAAEVKVLASTALTSVLDRLDPALALPAETSFQSRMA